MDFVSEEFETFKSSVNRMRWFVITSVIVSVLILTHIYLEQFSYQQHTLELIAGHRIKNNTEDLQECRKKYYDSNKDKKSNESKKIPDTDSCNKISAEQKSKIQEDELNNILDKYSETSFKIVRTDNAIKNTDFGYRQIPLLGINVPANDYVNVMALMLSVIVVGIWVNLVSINASLNALKKHNEKNLIELARLNTLFISHLETESGQFLAKSIRLIVIWLPFFSIITAGIISFSVIFYKLIIEKNITPFYGDISYIGFNFLYISLVSIFHLCIAIENRHVIKDINKFFKE